MFTGRSPDIVVRDHAHQDPNLIQEKALPAAAERVGERVDAQAMVRRWEGGDAAGEERRTDDDVWIWFEPKERGGGRGFGHAIVVRVFRLVVRVCRPVHLPLELSGFCHTEENDASVE